MDGAERIIRRILQEAAAKAEAVRAEAERKASATLAEAEQAAARTGEQILERAAKEALEQKRRILGMAELEARKELLAAKRELLGDAFRQALEKLAGLDEQAYRSLLRRMLLAAAVSGKEEVILSPRDRARLDREFWNGVNRDLAGAGRKGALTLAAETRELCGGFILRSGGVEINCSFESLLEMQREELEPEVAALLFG